MLQRRRARAGGRGPRRRAGGPRRAARSSRGSCPRPTATEAWQRRRARARGDRRDAVPRRRPADDLGRRLRPRASAADADALFRLADGALYWAKHHGRDVVLRYSPEVVRGALGRTSSAERLERRAGPRRASAPWPARWTPRTRPPAATPSAWRTSARSSRRRSAGRPSAPSLLREAGLVHDVGKIGVPDAILLQAGRLTDATSTRRSRRTRRSAPRSCAEVLDARAGRLGAQPPRALGRRAATPTGSAAEEIPEGAAHPRPRRRLGRHDVSAALPRAAFAGGRPGRVPRAAPAPSSGRPRSRR